jgi:hypothetical protein
MLRLVFWCGSDQGCTSIFIYNRSGLARWSLGSQSALCYFGRQMLASSIPVAWFAGTSGARQVFSCFVGGDCESSGECESVSLISLVSWKSNGLHFVAREQRNVDGNVRQC